MYSIGMSNDRYIHYNIPPYVEDEAMYVDDVLRTHDIGGDGVYTKKKQQMVRRKI